MSKNLDKITAPALPEKLAERRDFINPKTETENLNQEVLGSIQNKDFLSVDKSERLRHLTNPSVDGKKIENNQKIEFKFSFNGKLNKDLYLQTTAGQLMPSSVQELTVNNTVWIRSSLSGEFFNAQGTRLLIHDKTEAICSKVVSEKETQAIEQKIVGENDKYKSDTNYSIILECAKRNIPYTIASEIFGTELRKTGNSPSLVEVELLITKFERAKGHFAHDFPNIAIQSNTSFVPEFLSYFTAYNSIKLTDDIGNKFGITKEIKRLTDNGNANMGLEEELIDNGENLKGDALWNHPPFQEKVKAICSELGINPMHLKKIMEHESQINPKIVNKLTGKATGLIQFMPETARTLGTTTGKLRIMSGVDQLDYVKKYYAQFVNKGLNSVEDLYLATFYPKAIGKPDNYIIGSEGGNPSRIAMENPFPRSGEYVTVADINRFINT